MRPSSSQPHPFGERPARPRVSWPDLHVCPDCDRTFVVPLAVLDVIDDDRYLVELACTSCGWAAVRPEREERLEALDREVDRHLADMRDALELAELTRRLEEIDRFTLALRADLVLPEDF